MKKIHLFKQLSIVMFLAAMLLTHCSKETEKIETGNANSQLKNTWQGDISLSSQAAIDSIAAFGITTITGELLIGMKNDGFSNITDLTPLSTITHVGSLNIRRNNKLRTLEGLSIERSDDFVAVAVNIGLTNMNGLNSLTTIKGRFSINNNNGLRNLDGLENISSVGGNLNITNNSILDKHGYCGIQPLLADGQVVGAIDISGNKDNPAVEEILNMDCGSNLFWVPDDSFRTQLKWIVPNAFTPNDSLITDHPDVLAATDMDLKFNANISSLEGVQFFTALKWLNCSYTNIDSLDISSNTALDYLECYNNQLKNLDVSQNTALDYLMCHDNQLTSLDLSNNTVLRLVECGSNQLKNLDVSQNTALTELYCYDNQLTSLDVSNNTALITLTCGSNQLTSLDVSNNTVLGSLVCVDNQLTSLNMSGATALTELYCYYNNLDSLDVSNNTALTELKVDQTIKCEPSIVSVNPPYCFYWDGNSSTRYYPATDCP